jgi:2-polyprenyl-3-methyl-5-hydroxy-6-metoxy-1,4-benzoquinol methylase
MAPASGDVKAELEQEAAEYFGVSRADVQARIAAAKDQFKREWQQRVSDPTDEQAVVRFYNESQSELFELVGWHATDPIHYRTLMCLDVVRRHQVRRVLDFGSGIGSDAMVFAEAGYDVTLADVSDPLRAFAEWRLARRGHRVATLDLKTEALPEATYDAVVCFDVLEHIPRPLRTLDAISRSLRPGGLLFVHAPFGADPDRPMHVVHGDPISSRMRTVGFNWRGDLERDFPSWLWAPRVYQRFELSAIDRVGYYLYDVLMPGAVGQRLASAYRQLVPKRAMDGHADAR